MSERVEGRHQAREWLIDELACGDDPTVESSVELAAAVGQVEDSWPDDDLEAQALIQRGREMLAQVSPSILSDIERSLRERTLSDDLDAAIDAAEDRSEVLDWLMAADELARAARVLGLEEPAHEAFKRLADDIAAFPQVYAPYATFAEAQEAVGLGARLDRPLLRFWSELALSDLRAQIIERGLDQPHEETVQAALGQLFSDSARVHPVVVELSRLRDRQVSDGGVGAPLRLAAADTGPALLPVPPMERVGGAENWEAFVMLEGPTAALAVYGLRDGQDVTLEGPGGPVSLVSEADRLVAALDRPGEWILTVQGGIWPFNLQEGG